MDLDSTAIVGRFLLACAAAGGEKRSVMKEKNGEVVVEEMQVVVRMQDL